MNRVGDGITLPLEFFYHYLGRVLTQHTTKPGGVPPGVAKKYVIEFEEQNVGVGADGTSV